MAHATTAIKNPGKLQGAGGLSTLFLVLTVIGIAAFAGGLMTDKTRAWASFVQNHFYFMSLAIGGLFFAAIQWLTGAMWSAPVRRISESFTAYLPIAAITFIILYFGLHEVYIWTHADHVKGDIVLEHKAAYLNIPFFMIRNLVALAIWIFFAKKLVGNSIAQDASGDYSLTLKNRGMTPVFLILFAITFTMHAFDVLMSLDPHWFSTMFGVYCFAGMFYSILALTAIIAVLLRRNGMLVGIVTDDHLHDLGKFMFAFTVFYAYIAFSQFMLIWYANLPEETSYFMHRMTGSWMPVSIFLLVGKFMIPFFFLLPRESKRSEKMLLGVGTFMLIANWIDMLWIVQPEFFHEGPKFGWIELGVPMAFLGLFGFVVVRFLSNNTVVAIGDPRLAESVHHHHQ